MTSKFVAALLLVGVTGILPAQATGDAVAPLAPVASLDVPRYMGGWYEIAKFPNWFQRHCVSDTKAEYSLQPDGRVRVLNRCKRESGESDQVIGVARQDGAASSPRLEVRFAPDWLAFIPLVWADYWVIDIDDAYRLVAVSEPRRKYLWVLSRTPHVDKSAYEALLARLTAKGFDLSRLELTPQGG